MRARFERDGVLWVKNVIPRDRVIDMRRRYFEYVKNSGVLREGTDPADGIFCGGDPHKYGESSGCLSDDVKILPVAGPGVASHLGITPEESEFLAKSILAHKESWVHQFAQSPEIMEVVKRLKPHWEDPLLFMRQLLRSNMPNVSPSVLGPVHIADVYQVRRYRYQSPFRPMLFARCSSNIAHRLGSDRRCPSRIWWSAVSRKLGTLGSSFRRGVYQEQCDSVRCRKVVCIQRQYDGPGKSFS